jgi:hypothetical protein
MLSILSRKAFSGSEESSLDTIAWMTNTMSERDFVNAARRCTVPDEHRPAVNAVRAGHIAAAVRLLEASGDWDAALVCAAVTGRTALFDAALRENKLPILEEKHWAGSPENSFLALVAESCPLNTVQWLLARAPFPAPDSVDAAEVSKMVSHLMTSAARNPAVEVLRAVADALQTAFPSLTPGDVYACVCPRGSTPLFFAAREHNLRSVELILNASGARAAAAVATAPEDCTPLAAASGADAFTNQAVDSVAIAQALLAHVPATELAAYISRVPASGGPALHRAASQANTPLVILLLRTLHEAAGAGAAAEAAVSALFDIRYYDDFAAPGSTADIETRRTVDALLSAAAGVPLVRCVADPTALSRLRGLLMKRDDASDGEVAQRCLTIFSGKHARLPRCLLELILALTLPAASATMYTHMPLWRSAVKRLVTRQHLWNRRGVAFVNDPVPAADPREWRVSFKDSLDTRWFYEASCRCVAFPPPDCDAAASGLSAGCGPHVGELTIEPFCNVFAASTALSGPDGTCAVCRSTNSACVPHCAALRDTVDVADARLLTSIIAAAPTGIYTPPEDDEDCPFYKGSPELAPRPVRDALLQSMPSVFGPPDSLLHMACAALKPSVAWALICGGVDPAAEYTPPGTRGQLPLPAVHSAVTAQMLREPDELWLGKINARAAACLRVLQHAIAAREASVAAAAGTGATAPAAGTAWREMLLKTKSQGESALAMAVVTANVNVVRLCLEDPAVADTVTVDDIGRMLSRWPYSANNKDAAACVRATAAALVPALRAKLLRAADGDAAAAEAAWAKVLLDQSLSTGIAGQLMYAPNSYTSLAVLLSLGGSVRDGSTRTVLHAAVEHELALGHGHTEALAVRTLLEAARDGAARHKALQSLVSPLLPAAAQMGDDIDDRNEPGTGLYI